MHHSQLISDLNVHDSLYGLAPPPSAPPVVVFRGDGGLVGLRSMPSVASRGPHRATLVGLGDYLDDPFVDAIRSAALAAECDEDSRPTLPTPIPAVTTQPAHEVSLEPPLLEQTPSRRRHAVLLDGVHDLVAATYIREADHIVKASRFPGARRTLRQRMQDAIGWLSRSWSAACATVFG